MKSYMQGFITCTLLITSFFTFTASDNLQIDAIEKEIMKQQWKSLNFEKKNSPIPKQENGKITFIENKNSKFEGECVKKPYLKNFNNFNNPF